MPRYKGSNPADIYMFKVSNGNARTMYEIYAKLTIKRSERHHRRRSGVFIVNFEHISQHCSDTFLIGLEQVLNWKNLTKTSLRIHK